jgi:putative membrane protein
MVQHLLLQLAAPPLLLLGLPVPLARALVRHPLLAAIERGLGQPAVALVLYSGVMLVWHVPQFYEAALANERLHAAEHLTLLGTAVLFWWPVVGAAPLGSPLSYPARLLYTFLAGIPNSVLGAGIALSQSLLYPHYAERALLAGVDAQSDQVLAGLIMWIPGDLLFLTVLLLLLAAFLRQEERTAQRSERDLDTRELAAQTGAQDGRW